MPKLRTNPDNTRQLTTGPGYRYLLATDGPCPCCGGGGGGDEYQYYKLTMCDACAGSLDYYVVPDIWSCPQTAGLDCVYFKPYPEWPCGFVHRDDPYVSLPYPPTNPPPLTCEDIETGIFSCCECCTPQCDDTYHNDGQWTAVIERIIDQLWTWYGIDLHVHVPACCCPTTPKYMYGVQFNLKHWEKQEWTRHLDSIFLERRYRARGVWSEGDTQGLVWMRFDDYWYDEHFECDRARAYIGGDRCQVWPDVRMGSGDCPDVLYAVYMGTPTIINNPYGTIDRARLRLSCRTLYWDFAQTVKTSDGTTQSRYVEQLQLEWEYPLSDPCYQPCGPSGGKVPRPKAPIGPIDPIGVQPILEPP